AGVRDRAAAGVAVAEADPAFEAWLLGPERGERGGEIGAAAEEAGVLAGAVADAATVEAEHRMAGGGETGREPRLPGERARANLVAAADEQEAAGAGGFVERADERFALAGEGDVAAAHVRSSAAISAARASACAGSWSGSARSHRPAPPRSDWAILASAAPPAGSALSSSRIIVAPRRYPASSSPLSLPFASRSSRASSIPASLLARTRARSMARRIEAPVAGA